MPATTVVLLLIAAGFTYPIISGASLSLFSFTILCLLALFGVFAAFLIFRTFISLQGYSLLISADRAIELRFKKEEACIQLSKSYRLRTNKRMGRFELLQTDNSLLKRSNNIVWIPFLIGEVDRVLEALIRRSEQAKSHFIPLKSRNSNLIRARIIIGFLVTSVVISIEIVEAILSNASFDIWVTLRCLSIVACMLYITCMMIEQTIVKAEFDGQELKVVYFLRRNCFPVTNMLSASIQVGSTGVDRIILLLKNGRKVLLHNTGIEPIRLWCALDRSIAARRMNE
ncbi:MAG: hypothetical protein AAFY57_05410 [Cyanobacteria bacterium J06642_2]